MLSIEQIIQIEQKVKARLTADINNSERLERALDAVKATLYTIQEYEFIREKPDNIDKVLQDTLTQDGSFKPNLF